VRDSDDLGISDANAAGVVNVVIMRLPIAVKINFVDALNINDDDADCFRVRVGMPVSKRNFFAVNDCECDY